MKFSLKAIFALLTVSCLLALIFQEKLRIRDLNEQIVNVKLKISGYDSRLKKDMPLLRRAVKPDPTIDNLLAHVEANVEQATQKYSPENEIPGSVSIFYQPSLGENDPVTFQIYVPNELNVTLISKLIDSSRQPVDHQSDEVPFQPPQPTELQLPAGLSTIEIAAVEQKVSKPKSADAMDFKPMLTKMFLSVKLDGQIVYQATVELPADYRLIAPYWGAKDLRLDFSEATRSGQVAWICLTRIPDPMVSAEELNRSFYLRYSVELREDLDDDSGVLKAEKGPKD